MQTALPQYEVYALRYATREALRRNNFIGGDPHDGPMPMDYYTWVAIGPSGAYVIDTGFTAEMAKQRHRTFLRCPVESLALLGLQAGDVRDVILTHMHYDHVGNFDKFENARFHLQAREMAYATGKYMRYPRIGHSYHVEDVVGMVRLNFKGRVEMHGGEIEIAPGIVLHPTPGTFRRSAGGARQHAARMAGARVGCHALLREHGDEPTVHHRVSISAK